MHSKHPGFEAVATVADPLTDAGMREDPPHRKAGITRDEADRLAEEWSNAGYWTSVYAADTGECVNDFPPRQ